MCNLVTVSRNSQEKFSYSSNILESHQNVNLVLQVVRPTTTVERLRTAVVSVGLGRGMTPPLEDPSVDDVVDPYGHGLDVFEISAQQLVPALKSTHLVLRRALSLEF